MDRRLPLLGQKQVSVRHYSASAALIGDDSGMALSNEGAAGAITLSLPKANPGYEFRIHNKVAQNIIVQPTAADNFRGKGAGVSMANAVIGGLFKLLCIDSGVWEIEYNIGPFA